MAYTGLQSIWVKYADLSRHEALATATLATRLQLQEFTAGVV